MRRALGGMLFVLVAAVAGCASTRRSGDEDLPPAPAAEDYAFAVAGAICDRNRRCCQEVGGSFDESACMTHVGSGVAPMQGPADRYVPEQAQRCLQAHATEVCDIPRYTGGVVDRSACARVFSRGQTALGDRCDGSFECAASETGEETGCEFHDVGADGIIRTCQIMKSAAEGDACRGEDPLVSLICGPGLYCHEDGQCTAPAGLGQPCVVEVTGDDCADGLICDTPGFGEGGRCVKPLAPGAACEPGVWGCEEGYCPSEGHCTLLPVGSALSHCELDG